MFKKTCVPNGDKLLGYFQYSDRGAYRKLTEQEILNDLNETKPIKNKRQIFNEIGEEGANAYELFLDQLTDANFHTLRGKIEKIVIAEIELRNKR